MTSLCRKKIVCEKTESSSNANFFGIARCSSKFCFAKLFLFVFIVGLAWTIGVPNLVAADSAPVEHKWFVGGVDRVGLVYAPSSANARPTPVVFAFHGHGGTMQQAARSFAYHKHWPEAIVVYLQGLKTPGKLTDPEGKKPGWQHGAGAEQDRDLKFFDMVLTKLKSDYQVDESRIYSTGHSNGGGFTYLLWSQRGDVFAAVAPSASVAVQELKSLKPKPVLHVAGTSDLLVKFEWQERTIAAIRKLNGCEPSGQPWDKSGDLVGTIYRSENGPPVITLISPGDHKFPNEAPAIIVKFFKEYKKI